MKIAICSLTYPLPNGVTISINASIDEFKKRGIECIVISPNYDVGKFRPEHFPVSSSKLAEKIGRILGKNERTFSLTAYGEMKKIINEFNPDAFWLHTLTWAPNIFEIFIRKSNKPKVLTYHTMVEEYGRIYALELGAFIMRKRSKSVCEKMDSIITPSSVMKKKLQEYGVTKPIYVISTGIEIVKDQFKKEDVLKKFNIDSKNKLLLYVGRISKEKNLNVLLHLAVELKKRNYKAKIIFVGPGDIQITKKIASKMNISDMVIFSGALSKKETQRLYTGCDAFVFSSQTETQGLVIGEAMAAEIPVVALNSPIQKEIYPEDTAVVIYEESKFADQLIDILENEDKKKEMIKRAKKFVLANFSINLMFEKQMKIFEKLIKNN